MLLGAACLFAGIIAFCVFMVDKSDSDIGQQIVKDTGAILPAASHASTKPSVQSLAKAGGQSSGRLLDVSVEERQKFYDALLARDSSGLLKDWVSEFTAQKDVFKAGLIASALIARLQTSEHNEEFYQSAQLMLRDASCGNETKAALIRMLGRASTVASLQTLLDLHREKADLRADINASIEELGDSRSDGRFPDGLSPLLESAWRNAGDAQVRDSLAQALAKVGSPTGIDLLLGEVLATGKTIKEISATQDDRVLGAWAALEQVRNPKAISSLAGHLNYRGTDDAELLLSGDALANMGTMEATNSLLEWAKSAPDSFAPLVSEWFTQIRDSGSWNLVSEVLDTTPYFHSPLVQQAIAAVVQQKKNSVRSE